MSLNIDKIKEQYQIALDTMANMFKSLLSKNTLKDNKRVSLLSYWIKDYSNYILTEDSFSPKNLIRYKRGNIVQVEFGYRVGRELGGRHYAVVIDMKNDLTSDIVTVVPLMSLKPNFKESRYTFSLKKGLFDLYTEKIELKQQQIRQEFEQLNDTELKINEEYEQKKIEPVDYENQKCVIKKRRENLKIELTYLLKYIHEMEKLKIGTVVNAGQIITISKMRISNPKTNQDSLYGIKICEEDLDNLNSVIKKLYIK